MFFKIEIEHATENFKKSVSVLLFALSIRTTFSQTQTAAEVPFKGTIIVTLKLLVIKTLFSKLDNKQQIY
jgi:hypothetical protein